MIHSQRNCPASDLANREILGHHQPTGEARLVDIRQCETEEDRVAAVALMAELGAWDSRETEKLGFRADDVLDFYYPGDSEALDDIMPSPGLTLLAYVGSDVAGCIAYRQLDAATCEMKRLFVSPHFRQAGLGRALISALTERAGHAGYRRIRLETVIFMAGALRLYAEMGFVRRPPYFDIPEIFRPITIFMEKDLRRSGLSPVPA
jgi:GNAT superfamily N-acetyltransferase